MFCSDVFRVMFPFDFVIFGCRLKIQDAAKGVHQYNIAACGEYEGKGILG
jgi:hypothetical protein